jgi:hypothetical protein
MFHLPTYTDTGPLSHLPASTTATTILLPCYVCPPLTNQPAVLPTPGLSATTPYPNPMPHLPQNTVEDIFFPNLVSGLTPWNVILYYYFYFLFFIWLGVLATKAVCHSMILTAHLWPQSWPALCPWLDGVCCRDPVWPVELQGAGGR